MERNTEFNREMVGWRREQSRDIYIQRESERESEGKDERRANGMRTKEK